MTTLGHSLMGLAALTICLPPGITWRGLLPWAILFIALASLPDWPLPQWGHQRLVVSHSLWTNLMLCTLLTATLWRFGPKSGGSRRILICGALSWLSHLLLDTLYGDLPGVAIYWPFSDRLATLPLPWLKSLSHPPPPFDGAVIQILVLEAITFTPFLLAALWVRRRWPPTGRIG
ncbi:MAG: metal-dependent hydrolase [Desulfosarcinaceae bacterium]|nr:metal-dependent hydrolase [Desulfosarcinaceae bacterium]